MYNQYITQYETEIGLIKIERTFKDQDIDSIIVNVLDRTIELPKSMYQTDRTIVRKIISIFKK